MNMVKPDGTAVWVPDESMAAARQAGYRPESPEEAKKRHAGDEPVRAGAESAARAATFGLSDKFMKGYGVPTEDIANRREQNPVADLVGQGVGLVAGSKLPLAPAAVEGVAEGARGLVAGKQAGRVVKGLTEGGLWGLSSAITEDTLGDKQLSSEQLTAGVVAAALTGAGANVVLGTAGDLGRSALIKAFGGRPLRDALRDSAEQAVVRSVALPSDYAKRNLRNRASDIGRTALDEGLARPFESATQAAERSSMHAQGTYAEIEAALGEADTKARFLPSRAAARMQTLVDDWKGKIDPGTRDRLQGIVDDFLGPERPKKFTDAWKRQSEMRLQVGDQEPKLFKEKLFQLRGELQQELFDQAEAVTGQDVRGLNKKYADVAAFRDLATKKADRVKQNLPIGITDLLHGNVVAGALEGPLGLLTGAAATGASKLMRERGGFVLASALDKMAESKVVQGIATATQRWIKGGLASPAFGGPFRAILETAAAKGAMDALHTHVLLAENHPEYLATLGLEDERPDTLPDHADRAERLSRFGMAVDQQTSMIDGALAGFYKGNQGTQVSSKRHNYGDMLAKVRELQSQIPVLPSGLAQIAPATVAMASGQAANVAQFLMDRAPRNPFENMPPALRHPWEPADSDLARWSRYIDVATDPLVALNQMARGELTIETVETLQKLYPRLYKEFRDRASAQLGELQNPLPYEKKQQLELLLGLELTGDASQMRLLQTMHARNIPPMPQGKPDGRQKVSQEDNVETQAQRLEGKKAS